MTIENGEPLEGPFHDQFSTSDPDHAAELVRDSYQVQYRLVMSGDPDGFVFSHEMVGAGAFTVNRMRHTMGIGADTQPLDDLLVVNDVRAGRLSFDTTSYGDDRFTAGELALTPPDGGTFWAATDGIDERPVTLTRSSVAAYAAATCGIDPHALRFTGLRPISRELARHWRTTVDCARDLLANPPMAASPIAVEGTFRSLAAVLLSTFPNTALAMATDPDSPGVRGDVSAAVLREVVDYLDAHADQVVGPATIADLAGMPADEIVEGLRRRRGTDPARLLWEARLRGVHRGLRDADVVEGATVSDLAASWGFTDLGRFRLAYWRAFGESPEDTLGA